MTKMLHTKALLKASADSSQTGVINGVVGSTSVIDRMGDIIDQSGWDLKNYSGNPIILWGHNVEEEKLPIGKSLKTWVADKGKDTARLMFNILFDLQDSFAKEVYRKIKEGFLNTVSVGFIPTEWEELDPDNWFGGLKFTKQELLELSVVPVPANPEAVMPLRSFAKKDKRFTIMELNKLYKPVQTKEEFATMLGMSVDEVEKRTIKPAKDKAQTIPVDDESSMDEEGNITGGNGGGSNEPSIADKPNGAYDETTMLGDISVASFRQEMNDAWKNATQASDISTQNGKKPEKTKEDVSVAGTDPKDPYQEGNGMGDLADMPADNMQVSDMTVGHHRTLMNDVFGDWMSNLSTTTNQGDDVNDYSYTEGETKDATGTLKKMKKRITSMDTLHQKMSSDASKAVNDISQQDIADMQGHADAMGELCGDLSGFVGGKSVDTDKVKQVRSMLSLLKSGRVLSAKNEAKVRQAMELLNQVLNELEKEDIQEESNGEQPKDQEVIETKGVIGYSDHGKSPEGDSWDAAAEMGKTTDPAVWKKMCTWFDSSAPDNKGSYKLPHHKGDNGNPSVWRGVAAAMAALLGGRGGVDIPEGDRKGVYNHLVKHYKEYEKEPPEFKAVEDQVLAGFDEEIFALMLNQSEKHVVKLIKKVLENQKEERKEQKPNGEVKPANQEQVIQALEVINSALNLATKKVMRGGDEK